MPKIINLIGQRFGKWKVLDKPPLPNPKGYYWHCECDCGVIKPVRSWDLRNKISTSCGCSLKLEKGESACKWLFNHYKKQAKKRNFSFELTLEEFKILTKQNCHYCDAKPSNIVDRSSSNAYGTYTYNGIDRLNNSKGYTKKNSTPCCKKCNSWKSDGTKEEMISHAKKILKNCVHKVYRNP